MGRGSVTSVQGTVSFPVFWLPEAELDLKEALDWYERVNPDLAARFEAAVADIIDVISNSPFRFPKIEKDRRRAVLRRFPHLIIFRVQGPTITVIACFHGRRNPKVWRVRTENS